MQGVAPVASPVVVSTVQTTQRKEHYKSTCVLGLSLTQIVIGGLCIVLQIVLIIIPSTIGFFGQGIWAGSFFILTGAFGIASSKKKTACLIITFLILEIVSTVLAVPIILVSSFDMSAQERFYRFDELIPKWPAILAVNAVMFILALAEVVTAIVSSGLSCHGLYGGNQNQPVMVQYIQGPDGQQQMVILPLDQLAPGLTAGCTTAPDQTEPPSYVKDMQPQQHECETKVPISD